MSLAFPQLIKRLERHAKPPKNYGPVQKKAAVAIVLQPSDEGPVMLMIRRATREGDPWSGHMGFPGGRRDAEDVSSFACALRETREELGLDLEQSATALCELGDVNTGWRPDRPEMLVTPFVFVTDCCPELQPNHEVDGIVWVPLSFLMDRRHRVPLSWEWRGTAVESDSYLYEGNRIWGLSLMMIDELLEALSR